MRLSNLIAATLIAASVTMAATSAGLVMTPTQGSAAPLSGSNMRPYFTGKSNAGLTIGQNDTLMLAASGSDTTGQSRNRYSPLNPTAFWTDLPSNYQYAVSNKDSLIVYITAARVDADTGDVTVLLQGLVYGDTTAAGYAARGTYLTLGTANMPTNVAATRTRFGFLNPGGLGFRVRLTGATATDTTRIYRAEIYDK